MNETDEELGSAYKEIPEAFTINIKELMGVGIATVYLVSMKDRIVTWSQDDKKLDRLTDAIGVCVGQKIVSVGADIAIEEGITLFSNKKAASQVMKIKDVLSGEPLYKSISSVLYKAGAPKVIADNPDVAKCVFERLN